MVPALGCRETFAKGRDNMTMVDRGAHGRSEAMTGVPDWLGPESYWQPSHIVTSSAWLEHAPFAFWLMAQIRPRTVVELGTHYGFSYFVLAEAARRLHLKTELYALDSWEGDDQAGYYGEEVYDTVKSVADRDYAGITHLLRGYFADSRPLIADDSVDLLHIDGRHGYEDVKEDYEQWVSTVRDGGVILFHDTAERGPGFGVWRLWDEIASQHQSFAFTHCHGLGVVGIGNIASRGLEALFGADDSTVRTIRADYEQLGSVVSRQATLEAMPAEIDSLHVVVDSLSSEIDRLRLEVDRLREDVAQSEAVIEDLMSSTSWKVTRPVRFLGAALAKLRSR
jgi:predicted O-methyltransferase YrrM